MIGAYKLSGLVEADEGYVGGREEGPGRSGRGAESKSVVVAAVEQRGPGKPGVPGDRSSSLGWKPGVPGDRSSSLGWKPGQKPVPGFAALEVVP